MSDNIIIFPLDVVNYLDSETAINDYIDSMLKENPTLLESACKTLQKPVKSYLWQITQFHLLRN